MWGQVDGGDLETLRLRIIPTRVGTSRTNYGYYLSVEDHPHACGDKLRAYLFLNPLIGSSPRVWGQVSHHINGSWDLRIIPTRVGTSTVDDILKAPEKDHPHACGDKILLCIHNQRG